MEKKHWLPLRVAKFPISQGGTACQLESFQHGVETKPGAGTTQWKMAAARTESFVRSPAIGVVTKAT